MRKRMVNTYQKANWALGIAALGLVVAFPFQGNFWGGLITSGCSAGLVGGLADWFAVTALFRKPLGIRPGRIFRTEIIPRNRERIFQELTHMVQDELLATEAIMQKLAGLDFAVLFEKLTDPQGLVQLEPSARSVVTHLLESLELAEVVPDWSLQDDPVPGRDPAWVRSVREMIRTVYTLSLANGTLSKALNVLADELSLWVQSPEMQRTLTKWIENALDDYVRENSSRKIVMMFLPDATTLAKTMQMKASNALQDGEAVQAALDWLETFVPSARFDAGVSHLLTKVLKNEELRARLQMLLRQPERTQEVTDFLLHRMETVRRDLQEKEDQRLKLNRWAQTILSQFVVRQHDRIGRIVREGLEKYSDEKLVALIEAKAGADLQMIRINGSVVGALVGMLFYIISIWF